MPRRRGGMGSRRRSSSSSSGGFFSRSKPAAKPTATRPRPAARPTTSPVPTKSSAAAKKPESKPSASQSTAQQPAQAPQQPSGGGGMLAGIGSTIMQGMAFGAGSSVAHRAVDAVMGPREHVVRHEGGEQAEGAAPVAEQQQGPCAFERQEMQRCMQEGSMQCDFFYNKLKQCQMGISGQPQQQQDDGYYTM